MEDYRELFKRELDRLSYIYAKANTKSKKKRIAYDLIFFEDMFNGLDKEKVVFPWSYDEDLIDIRLEVVDSFLRNVMESFGLVYGIAESNFNVFLEEEFSIHKYYGKFYHKMDEVLIQKNIGKFFREIDSNLVERFKYKLENLELFVNQNIGNYDGLTFPIESVDKNIIFFKTDEDMCIDDARILVHEMGHDFEFDNAKKAGVVGAWGQLSKTLFTEVSSSFFEYAFINYLIDNKIYLEDAKMLKGRYLYQLFHFLSYVLIIGEINHVNIDYNFDIKIVDDCVIEYANSLLEKMNVSSEFYDKEDTLNFRHSFIFGIGKLLSVYIYEEYKDNSKEFLVNIRKMLLDYKDNGFESLRYLNIDEEKLMSGDVLRKTLKLYNQDR